MDKLTRTGKLIFAIPLAALGVLHIVDAGGISSAVPSYFPAPVFWVYLTGSVLVLASISIIVQRYTRLACLLLALMFLLIAFLADLPGLFNPQIFQTALISFLKNISLAGGALVIAAVSSIPEPL